MMRHALGLDGRHKTSWRNHYVVGSGPDHDAWMALFQAGYAGRRLGNALTGGDDLFWLTQIGAEAALDDGETLSGFAARRAGA